MLDYLDIGYLESHFYKHWIPTFGSYVALSSYSGIHSCVMRVYIFKIYKCVKYKFVCV